MSVTFFYWLEKHSNYQERHVKWNDSPDIIRIAIEDYLKSEMKCRVRERIVFALLI